MIAPPRWTADELERDRQQAIAEFRRQRLQEPLEAYLDRFDKSQGSVEEFLELTVDLNQLRDKGFEVLSNPTLLEVFRFLTGPFISLDDLKTVAEAPSLSNKSLGKDPELVRRVVDQIFVALDRRRFPWVSEGREATEAERHAAALASAALIATQRIGTARRHESKQAQERQVEDALLGVGFKKVRTRQVPTLSKAPDRGEFCGESMLGSRKADFLIRLWDDRVMPSECKVSNSATNSVKRLNNDAAAKAEAWRKDFGETQVVPTAVLGGVYKLNNLEEAQRRGLTLFWAQDLQAMLDWIEKTKSQ